MDFLSRFRGGRKSRQAHKTARRKSSNPQQGSLEAGGYVFFP
jgi:hypothetical protein